MFNIFENIKLQKATEEELKKYLDAPEKYKSLVYQNVSDPNDKEFFYGFEAFCNELRRLILWQESGRYEYEIGVIHKFATDVSHLKSFDCYDQCLPNIECIARDVVYQYNQQRKEEVK
jgi:hypothetical protein